MQGPTQGRHPAKGTGLVLLVKLDCHESTFGGGERERQ
jgi:hypothetical protein